MGKALGIVESFSKEKRDDPAVFQRLVDAFGHFTTEELQLLIAEEVQAALPEFVYVTRVINEQHIRAGSREQTRRRLNEAKNVTFRDYSEEIGVPQWRRQAKEPQADLETLSRQGSLTPILDRLRSNANVHIMHNADDFLNDRGSLDELKEALGDQLTLHPTGGHLGDLWYSKNREDILRVFRPSLSWTAR